MRPPLLLPLALGCALMLAGCSSSGETAPGQPAQDVVAAPAGDGAAAEVLAQAPPPTTAAEDGERIVVEGTGRVTGRPDTLRATVGVELVREDVQAALDAANERAQAVLDALTAAGVAERDVQTRDLSVRPRYDENGATITGYAVRNTVEVRVRDLDRTGAVLQAALEAGGPDARLDGVSFSLEDNEALLADAREAAFGDARTKAEQYADLASAPLGRVLGIEEMRAAAPQAIAFEEAAGGAGVARAAPPVSPGEQEVRVEVRVTFALDAGEGA